AFKRAGVLASYSHGFHPQPLFSFGPALAVGIESEAELFDFETAVRYEPDDVRARLNRALPAGLCALEVWAIAPGGASLAARLDVAEYRAWINASRRALVPEEFDGLDLERFHDPALQSAAIAALLQRAEIEVSRSSKGSTKTVEVRQFVREVQ